MTATGEAVEQEVKPLACGGCGASVVLEDRDELVCHHCGARVAVPPGHREALRAEREDAAARSEAARLYAEISRPVAWWLRAVTLAFGGLVEAIWRWKAALLIRLGAAVYVGALNFLVLVGGVLFALFLPFLFYGHAAHRNTAETLSYAEANQRDVFVLGLVVVILLVGAALSVYGRKSAIEVGQLQAALAARAPLHPGGPASCRECGGPLRVGPDDVGVRCLYCKTDNLVAVPAKVLALFQHGIRTAERQIEAAHAQMQAEARARKRQVLGRVAALGAVLAVWFGGTFVRVEMRRAATPPLDVYPPYWTAYMTDPRPVLRRPTDPKTHAWASRTEKVAMPAGCQGPAPTYAPDSCAGGTCETALYLALRRGDQVHLRNLGQHPVQAELSWHRIAGLPPTIHEPFGTVSGASALAPGGSAELTATWSSWHELRLTEPGAREGQSPAVCVEISKTAP